MTKAMAMTPHTASTAQSVGSDDDLRLTGARRQIGDGREPADAQQMSKPSRTSVGVDDDRVPAPASRHLREMNGHVGTADSAAPGDDENDIGPRRGRLRGLLPGTRGPRSGPGRNAVRGPGVDHCRGRNGLIRRRHCRGFLLVLRIEPPDGPVGLDDSRAIAGSRLQSQGIAQGLQGHRTGQHPTRPACSYSDDLRARAHSRRPRGEHRIGRPSDQNACEVVALADDARRVLRLPSGGDLRAAISQGTSQGLGPDQSDGGSHTPSLTALDRDRSHA